MKQSQPIFRVFGDGQPSLKTQGLVQSRKFSAEVGFRDLDIAAFTQAYFSDFYRRSGLLDFESEIIKNPYKKPDINKMLHLGKNTPFSMPETEGILQGFNEVRKPDIARNDAYLRSDEPWRGVGTGLGNSRITKKEMLENHVKAVLSSQFLWDAVLFKMMKGLANDHFGLMITNVVRNVRRRNKYDAVSFSPEVSVNYLGKFNNKALMQYCKGFMDPRGTQTALFEGGIPENGKFDVSFEGLPAILSKMPESCYLEAILSKDDFVKGKIWTLVQYWPVEITAFSKPKIDEKSIIFKTGRAIGTVKAATKGVNPDLSIFSGKLDGLAQTNRRSIDETIEFNSTNKEYLFAASFFQLEQMREMPVAAFSNCGAMLLHSDANENEASSHLNGFIRELGVPVIIIKDEKKYRSIRRHAEGRLFHCADEFKNEGWISTDVPSDMAQIDSKQNKPFFLKRLFHF